MCYIIKEIKKILFGSGNMLRKHSALDISLFVIDYCCKKNTPISNLQLQKILYYIQAAFLVNYDRECFSDEIVNWAYGPVVENVYQEFKQYGYENISCNASYIKVFYNKIDNNINFKKIKTEDVILDMEEKLLIEKVTDVYREKDPFYLVNRTHKEDPWLKSKRNNIIEKEEIKKYFKKNPTRIFGV